MIIAVHRAAIDATYGAGAWNRLEPELRRYALALGAGGLHPALLYLDAPAASGLVRQSPAAIKDAAGAARLIRARALGLSPRPPAVLLIGGDEALPMHRLPKPETVAGDADTLIPTDNPYGCLVDDKNRFPDPDLPVGRVAAGVKDGIDALIAQLQRLRQYRIARHLSSGSFALSNRDWEQASKVVTAALRSEPVIVQDSPFYQLTPDDVGALNRSVLFFNLHGTENAAAWFGGDLRRPWIALEPRTVLGSTLPGSTVFACNCYGAAIEGRWSQNSIALAMLSRGSLCFIGATGYSLVALSATHAYSEDLALRFFNAWTNGKPAGLALRQARHAYVARRLAEGGLLPCDYKTALQFVFLGDPLL